MTAPVTQLPHLSLGNLATDLSTGGASLVKGLKEEQQRRREQAMSEALLQIRQQEANARMVAAQRPSYGSRMQFRQISTPEGLRYISIDPFSGESHLLEPDEQLAAKLGTNALVPPESQFAIPTQSAATGLPTVALQPRYTPGAAARPAELPSGQVARMEVPVPMQVETPQGPQVVGINRRLGTAAPIVASGGQAPAPSGDQMPSGVAPSGAGEPIRPRAQQFEVEKAQFAANMARAASGMEQVYNTAPQAIDEVVGRLNVQGVLQTLPGIGSTVGEIVQRSLAIGLSPEAANWLANFYTFVGFAVPELAGKQMTITEMRQQVAMFVPLTGEPESARRIKRENVQFRVESAQRAAGSGALRVGTPSPEAPPVSPPSRYGYVRP